MRFTKRFNYWTEELPGGVTRHHSFTLAGWLLEVSVRCQLMDLAEFSGDVLDALDEPAVTP